MKGKGRKGKAYGVVLNAVKFKLVGRMFAVVKRGTPFVELMTYKSKRTEIARLTSLTVFYRPIICIGLRIRW